MAEDENSATKSHLPQITIQLAWSKVDDEDAPEQSAHQATPALLDSRQNTHSILVQTRTTKKPESGSVNEDTEKTSQKQCEIKHKELGTGSQRASTATAMSSSEARMIFSQMKIEGRLMRGPSDPCSHQKINRGRRNTEYFGKNHIGFTYNDIDSKTFPKYVSNRTELLRRRRSTSFCASDIQDQLTKNSNKGLSISEGSYRRPSFSQMTPKGSHQSYHSLHPDSHSPMDEHFNLGSRLRSYSTGETRANSSNNVTVPQLHLQKQESVIERTKQDISLPDPNLKPSVHPNWTQNLKRRNSITRSISLDRNKRSDKIPERKMRSYGNNNEGGSPRKGSTSHVWKLKREHSFEITYPGYDARFKEFSPMCIAVGGDMDTALQQLRASSVEKCKKWLHNVPTAPEILN